MFFALLSLVYRIVLFPVSFSVFRFVLSLFGCFKHFRSCFFKFYFVFLVYFPIVYRMVAVHSVVQAF